MSANWTCVGLCAHESATKGGEIVHAGHEPVGGADVAKHLDVQVAAQLQAPCSSPLADAGGEPLVGVAQLEVVGVEVHGFTAVHRQGDRAMRYARVVERGDLHGAATGTPIDHPREPLLGGVGCRREQRHSVNALVILGRSSGDVGQMAGGALHQAHHLDRIVRLDGQPPLALAVAKRPGKALGIPAFELPGGQLPARAAGNRNLR